MPRLTPIYRLPYLDSGEVLTGPIDRNRFLSIDRQLEAIFTFLGNGIISGWNLVKDESNPKRLRVTRGSGVVASVAAASASDFLLDAPSRPTDSSLLKNNVYLKLLGQTPYTAQGEFLITTETFSSETYLPLGYITVDSSGNISEINETESSGRKSLELIRFISSLIEDHVHTGAPGEPDKIDLFNHVKGILSSTNIEDLPASKITSGIISKDRFNLSHSDLSDIGTLSHEEIDSLIEKLQTLNAILFGDIMTANLIQLILSMKHVFSDIDDYMHNFAAIIPGIGNNDLLNEKSFIDINATTAELDFDSHLIKGKFVDSKELGQYTINTEDEFNEGNYNSTFISVSGDTSVDRAYGYGYGYGSGLNYFDVIMTNFSSNTFSLDETVFDFEGSLYGYGYDDGFGNDFESIYADSYGYGYGFEYGFGFNGTSGAIVYLNSLGADELIHDKDEGDIFDSDLDTTDSATTYPLPSASSSPVFLDTKTLISFGSQSASIYDGIISGKKRRSSTVNSSTSPDSTSIYSYSSILNVLNNLSTPATTFLKTDKSIMFAVWEDAYDVTTNNFINFILKKSSGTFDSSWTYDYNMDLLVEATVPNVGTDDNRYYYRYTAGSANPSSYRFFTRGDTPFSSGELDENGTEIATISAELSSSNLEFLMGYAEPQSLTPFDPISNIPNTSLSDLGWDSVKDKITGIYLLTTRSDGYEGVDNTVLPIYWPQGQRNLMEDIDDSIDSSSMLADIDKIFFSGSFEYPANLDNNKIENLSVNFPVPVSLESISWVSTEPGDSLIYLQIKKNASPISGGDTGEIDYRDNLFFTKNSDDLKSGGSYNTLFSQKFGEDPGDTLRTYISSGEALPTVFSEIYKNSYGFTIRAVLLPTSDKLATPVLNSITINYSSETSRGSITIDSQDDFDSYRSAENVKIDSGQVSILETGRTGNVIYGSNKKIVELKETFSERYTDIYSGENLPKTSLQILNNSNTGIVGNVTDLKILKSGNILFLDRDASRIIEINNNREIVNIYCSEYSFNRVYESDPSIPASLKGKIVDVVFNRQLSDNGILYVVFSHELNAWFNGVVTPSDSSDNEEINVRPEAFSIRYKGLSRNLSDSISIYAVDRGVLAFELSAETSNWIESVPNAILDSNFYPDSETLIPSSSSSSVKFENENIPVENLDGANIRITITKLGNKGIVQNSYNKMYLPIQGTVAFNVDDDGYFYILKKARPYSWDTEDVEPWYVKVNPREFWKTKISSNLESNLDFPQGSFAFDNQSNPSFYTNSFFGSKGSIEKKGTYLLMSMAGEKDKGAYVFRRDTSSDEYGLPTQISLPVDGTYPMDIRFDPKTFSNTDYGDIYVALSDLKRSATGTDSISRFIKISPDNTIDWTWGEESPDASIKFSIGANGVRPLSLTDSDALIFSV